MKRKPASNSSSKAKPSSRKRARASRPDLVVRKATGADLADVLNLNQTLPGRDRFSRAELCALVGEKRVRVAYLDATPCGFFILLGNRLLAILVAPPLRRNGYGFALVCEAVNAGARRCEVRAGNFASEQMFRKAGFRVETIKPGVYADGEAALVMRLEALL